MSIQAFSQTSLLLIRVYQTDRFVCDGASPDTPSSALIHGLFTHTAILYVVPESTRVHRVRSLTPQRLRQRVNDVKPRQVCVIVVLVTICERAPCLRLQPYLIPSALRARLPISRSGRRVAVQASPSRTEFDGRQNHAEVSYADLLVAFLTESEVSCSTCIHISYHRAATSWAKKGIKR